MRGEPSGTARSIRFLTHSPPAPGISGDRIRVFHLMRELKRRGWTVRLWSLVPPDEPGGFAGQLGAVTDEAVLVPRGISGPHRVARLSIDTVMGRAFHEHWFWSPATARAASAWLADASTEPIFVEQLYMYPFVPAHVRGLVVLDTQNHEAARIRAIARSEGGTGRRSIARLQARAVERYERKALRSVGRILAVSPEEADAFAQMAPGRVSIVPNGVDTAAISPLSAPPVSRDLLFVGSLAYSANRDAVSHFATDIAPRLANSSARLTVVGSNPSAEVLAVAGRASLPITVTGYVPEIAPYFRTSRAMVVPLRHGGGTRLKILEALAWGLPVVTTTIGGAGLGLVNGTHALIADEPVDFAKAVEDLLHDDALWARLSNAGRALVEARYSWSHIGDALETAVTDIGASTGSFEP
ncbi:MAG: glycosyltransferase family 4 protein [Chloroflexota bacterium]